MARSSRRLCEQNHCQWQVHGRRCFVYSRVERLKINSTKANLIILLRSKPHTYTLLSLLHKQPRHHHHHHGCSCCYSCYSYGSKSAEIQSPTTTKAARGLSVSVPRWFGGHVQRLRVLGRTFSPLIVSTSNGMATRCSLVFLVWRRRRQRCRT